MKGRDLINLVGKSVHPNFNLELEKLSEMYPKVYENFVLNFEQNNLKKGIAIIGEIGAGKSMCMRIMQKILKDTSQKFVYKKAKDLIDMVDEVSITEIKEQYGGGLLHNLYLDDIGVGQPIKNHYGNNVNIISEIILDRYDLFVSKGIKTHFSSNKPTTLDKKKYPDIVTLEDILGDRVIDRIFEMCNIIVWQGKSLRRANYEK